jgi:hypothetical protein
MVQPGKNPNSVGKKIPSLLINSSFLAAQIHHCQVTLQVPAEWKRNRSSDPAAHTEFSGKSPRKMMEHGGL